MPHNMLATLITDLKLPQDGDALAKHDDIELEVKALGILDTQVKEVASELAHAQSSLAHMTQEYQDAQTKLTNLVMQIKTHEGYALQAIQQDNETLALDVAEKIASLEESHSSIEDSTKTYEKACTQLSGALHQNELNLFMLKQQIDTVKSTESVHKAQIAMSVRYAKEQGEVKGSETIKLRTARDALAKLQAKQIVQATENALLTCEKIGVVDSSQADAILHKKLIEAGISIAPKKAEEILARIRQQN